MSVAALVFGGIPAAAVLALAVGAARSAWAPWAGAVATSAMAVGICLAWLSGHDLSISLGWVPQLGSDFVLRLDALAAPLSIFIAGLAAVVFVYTAGYLPKHLKEHGQGLGEQARFSALLVAFVLAMLWLVCAQDLLTLFAALEVSAVASYGLIGFDRTEESKRAALTALVVTAGVSMAFAIGVVLVSRDVGSTRIEDVVAHHPQGIGLLPAALLAIGVIAKSAQVPLHFWLPRAMVAPTPVSAYLHSAALVAAGVFTLMRIRPLLAPEVLLGLRTIGIASIVVGGLLALVSDSLKRILAHSTIAQLGYATLLVGLGGEKGFVAAPFFLVAHGLCKSALFLTAGAVTSATGIEDLSKAGGLGRKMPLLAVGSGVACAGLAGLPLTVGYFRDELFLGSAAHHGPAMEVFGGAAAALTLVYVGRFWLGLFAGSARAEVEAPQRLLTFPVAALAAVILVMGVWPAETAFSRAGEIVGGRSLGVDLRYAITGETAIAGSAWLSGGLALAVRGRWERPLHRAMAAVTDRLTFERAAHAIARAFRWASTGLHEIELRDLRDRLSAVLIPTAVLVLAALALTTRPSFPVGSMGLDDLPPALALGVAAFTAMGAARAKGHLELVILLSFVGFSVAMAFAFWAAPDVALTMVIIETVLTLLFVAVLWALRPPVIAQVRRKAERGDDRGPAVGLFVGATAFLLTWFALESPVVSRAEAAQVDLTEAVHAKDMVTAVLTDFRGLDTAAELTVLALGAVGAAAISWGRSS